MVRSIGRARKFDWQVDPELATIGPVRRFWIYQRERFPLVAHGPLIAVFSFSAVSFSHLVRNSPGFPRLDSVLVAFATCLLLFLQLRIADEFKDADEDARYRPYRPVPRGLVSLRELGFVGVLAAGTQLGMAFWLDPGGLPWEWGSAWTKLPCLLLLVWLYLGCMSREFFARTWLKARPFTYLWTHMLIMPLADLYATACDWRAAGGSAPPNGLFWFLIVSFFNGVVLEIGRKIRAPENEEHGVETYSRIWGRENAVAVWLLALALTGFCAWRAASQIGHGTIMSVLLAGLFLFAAGLGWRFLAAPTKGSARWLEGFSGTWTLLMYLGLGAFPLLVRYWHASD